MIESAPVSRPDSTRSEILTLTGLRFVAALYVFVFHIHLRWPIADGALGNLFSNGAAGMTLFFVLSGYVLAYQYSQRRTTWRSYATNRFARIWPVYALAAFITLPWLLMDMSREGWPDWKFAGILLTNLVGIQAWFPYYFRYWNNGASWSVSAEIFFYAVFPLLLPLIVRMRRLWLLLPILYISCIAPSVLFGISGMGNDEGVPIFYAMPIFRIPEFIIGICLQRIVWQGRRANIVLILSLSALIVCLLIQGTQGIYVTNNWFVVPLISLIIIASTRSSGGVANFLSSKYMVFLGKSSYCFYSFQFFVILVAVQVLRYLQPINPLAIFLGCLSALLVLSLAGYRYVEEPARRWIQRRAATTAAR